MCPVPPNNYSSTFSVFFSIIIDRARRSQKYILNRFPLA